MKLRPETLPRRNKAVAVGAISFHIDRFVRGRLSKFTYGVPCSVVYIPSDPEHVKRQNNTYIDLEGDRCVPDAFTTMLSKVSRQVTLIPFVPLIMDGCIYTKGTRVLESREIRTKRWSIREGGPTRNVLAQIVKYHGNQEEPEWMDVERGGRFNSVTRSLHAALIVQKDRFETLCHVVADISAAPHTRKRGTSRKFVFTQVFDVVLLVGLTELKAQIRWIDSKTVCSLIITPSKRIAVANFLATE